MQKARSGHTCGIAIVAFTIAAAVSIGYYQFIYIPQVNTKPILPEEVLGPEEIIAITITEGASLESNSHSYVPKEVRATIGVSNKVLWTNGDTVPHTVTSDDGYVDKINGPFNSLEQQEKLPGGFLKEGQTFDFTFTQVGEYRYYCVPHPHMRGTVVVVENFA